VTQKRNRVVVTATLAPSLLTALSAGENSLPENETGAGQGASK